MCQYVNRIDTLCAKMERETRNFPEVASPTTKYCNNTYAKSLETSNVNVSLHFVRFVTNLVSRRKWERVEQASHTWYRKQTKTTAKSNKRTESGRKSGCWCRLYKFIMSIRESTLEIWKINRQEHLFAEFCRGDITEDWDTNEQEQNAEQYLDEFRVRW